MSREIVRCNNRDPHPAHLWDSRSVNEGPFACLGIDHPYRSERQGQWRTGRCDTCGEPRATHCAGSVQQACGWTECPVCSARQGYNDRVAACDEGSAALRLTLYSGGRSRAWTDHLVRCDACRERQERMGP